MLLLYNIFIRLYFFFIRLAAIRNKKAAAWVGGRKNLFSEIQKQVVPGQKIIWVHCSSAGELEQGKPVIEGLKKNYPAHKILVSFFSPSGMEAAKGYAAADYLFYLPLDTKANAEKFLQLAKPVLVVFVKYEFWYHHLSRTAFHHIPLLLISATFRPGQVFFKAYGRFFKQMLLLFRHIFVQDEASLNLLLHHGITASSLSGDTRFDRTEKIATDIPQLHFLTQFKNDKKLLVCGSTWPDDEKLLADLSAMKNDLKLVIVPHEISPRQVAQTKMLFPAAVFYSVIDRLTKDELSAAKVLVIDATGLLSRCYYYGDAAYVGGGFTSDGIHNILEAAVWGKPVLFGPNYKKYREAKEMIAAGAAFSFNNAGETNAFVENLFTQENFLAATGEKAKNYVLENVGATQKILQTIQEKRLLTN